MNALIPNHTRLVAFIVGAALLIRPQVVHACAVCFGDPESDMARGAVRGVAFMIAVTAAVLVSIASIAGVWIVRARRIARHTHDGADTPPVDDLEHPIS